MLGIIYGAIWKQIMYAPIRTTFPSNMYWCVSGFTIHGFGTSIPASYAGIVDTGTTCEQLIYLLVISRCLVNVLDCLHYRRLV